MLAPFFGGLRPRAEQDWAAGRMRVEGGTGVHAPEPRPALQATATPGSNRAR